MDREKQRRWVLTGLLLVGGLLRLAMIEFPRLPDGETAVYAALGRNLLQHGLSADGVLTPSTIRMPGYPLLLSLLGGRLEWLRVLQASLELLGYTLLARNLWRWAGERSGDLLLALGSLCVFMAVASATASPESLLAFAAMLGIWGMGNLMLAKTPSWRRMLPVAGAGALAMLLRPDGVVLAVALVAGVAWYGRERWGQARALRVAGGVGTLAALPLVPWVLRNWWNFHAIQPFAIWVERPYDLFFWWQQHPVTTVAFGLLALAYGWMAVLGFARRLVPFGGWMMVYVFVRLVLLAVVRHPEPRAIVELFPMVMVGAACWLGGRHAGRWGLGETVQAGESDLAELFAESFPVVEDRGLELVQRP